MAEYLPLHYAQSLLRLVPMSEEQLRAELKELNLPLVLVEMHRRAHHDRGRDDLGFLVVPHVDRARARQLFVRRSFEVSVRPGEDGLS